MKKHYTRWIQSALSVIKVQFERFIYFDMLKSLSIFIQRSFSSDREIQQCKVQVGSTSLQVQEMKQAVIVSDEEIDKQELEAHYTVSMQRSEVLPAESSSTDTPLEQIPYDTSDPANRFCPNGEETVTLKKESRSKLDKDKVKPYDYTYQNSLYETFKTTIPETYLD
ncbi:hypothetical protein Tco_0104389 [Tanacetum coccineum]